MTPYQQLYHCGRLDRSFLTSLLDDCIPGIVVILLTPPQISGEPPAFLREANPNPCVCWIMYTAWGLHRLQTAEVKLSLHRIPFFRGAANWRKGGRGGISTTHPSASQAFCNLCRFNAMEGLSGSRRHRVLPPVSDGIGKVQGRVGLGTRKLGSLRRGREASERS